MPSVLPPAKVLVSGANGYIAVWVVKTLLEKGYSVRGTVRSQDKGKHLLETFKSYGDKFEIVVVSDITAEGAFDEAVKGVDAIEHTASPFHFNADDPDELIKPAVDGTVGILKSALKYAPTAKRVVVTSSCASVMSVHPEPRDFTEEDWNEQAIETVKKEGKNANQMAKYRASKTLAEKAAWEFWKTNKDKVQWDLVCLNPPFVFGPAIHEVTTAGQLNTSAKSWYDHVVRPDSSGKSAEFLTASASSWIDVRDLGVAHTLALEKEEAGGERIIISAGSFTWQDMIDVANQVNKSGRTLPKGTPGAGTKVHLLNYKTDKEASLFGMRKRTIVELVSDTLEDFDKRGW
ncbi:hypothetical protein DL96DRAFT_1607040 [Flagelloscypha sp. PMI_526]|nr:hypothetical protein DL96DRAFT_1607040 [Flagelloscypha sp. PMI_526]